MLNVEVESPCPKLMPYFYIGNSLFNIQYYPALPICFVHLSSEKGRCHILYEYLYAVVLRTAPVSADAGIDTTFY